MQSSDLDRDEDLRAKRREGDAETGPRAERPNRLGWASALGNAAVQRLLRSVGVQRSGGGSGSVEESVAEAIKSKQGSGQGLDSGASREMGASMDQDFSDVRVHADAEADALNKAVRADAFTTGRDIFFREGKYQPGSSEGRKLLAHELTHVVQQRGAPASGGDMSVSSPDDASERQAGAVADKVSASPTGTAAAVGRQEEEEEMQASPSVDRQEEEEEMQASPAVGRQEEEEEMQASPSVDRQEEEEEMQASPAVERQPTQESVTDE